MTDLTAHRSIPVSDARSTYSQRQRWRFANTAITASFGATVLAASIYLGVTGPAISPVTPAAVATTTGSATGPTASTGVDQQRNALDGGGPQDRAGGFRGHDGRGR